MSKQKGFDWVSFTAIACLVVLGIRLVCMTIATYYAADSRSLYHIFIDAMIDFAVAIGDLWCIKLSRRAPSKAYPFGYGKFEYSWNLVQGAVLVGMSLNLIGGAIEALGQEVHPQNIELGSHFALVAVVLTALLSMLEHQVACTSGSAIIYASTIHHVCDVLVYFSGWIGMVSLKGGYIWADKLVAICLAIGMFYSGSRVIWGGLTALCDKRLPERLCKKLSEVIASALEGREKCSCEVRRSRTSGRDHFVELLLRLPGNATVEEVALLKEHLNHCLASELPSVSAQFEIEPLGHSYCSV